MRLRALCFFFFQAEDGIRDGRVTGVQTCALPIWAGSGSRGCRVSDHASPSSPAIPSPPTSWPCVRMPTCTADGGVIGGAQSGVAARSGEGRGGGGGSGGGAPQGGQEKNRGRKGRA